MASQTTGAKWRREDAESHEKDSVITKLSGAIKKKASWNLGGKRLRVKTGPRRMLVRAEPDSGGNLPHIGAASVKLLTQTLWQEFDIPGLIIQRREKQMELKVLQRHRGAS